MRVFFFKSTHKMSFRDGIESSYFTLLSQNCDVIDFELKESRMWFGYCFLKKVLTLKGLNISARDGTVSQFLIQAYNLRPEISGPPSKRHSDGVPLACRQLSSFYWVSHFRAMPYVYKQTKLSLLSCRDYLEHGIYSTWPWTTMPLFVRGLAY